MNENDGKQLQRRRAWMAFGVGRRRCVAERLSILQLKIALIFIFRDNISLDLPSNAEVSYFRSILLDERLKLKSTLEGIE